jgi:hypothetical protein
VFEEMARTARSPFDLTYFETRSLEMQNLLGQSAPEPAWAGNFEGNSPSSRR